MIKPEFFESSTLGACSTEARILFIALWVFGNDYGNMKIDLSKIRTSAFRYDCISDSDVLGYLCELEAAECIRGYAVESDAYVNVPNFDTYQYVRKPNKSNVPDVPKDYQKRTEFFKTWKACDLNEALVRYQCGTSDEPSETQSDAAQVTHQYGTGNAKRKKEGKKEVANSSKEELATEREASRGAAVHKPTPRDAVMVCPDCGVPMERTNMRKSGTERHYWRCPECQNDICE